MGAPSWRRAFSSGPVPAMKRAQDVPFWFQLPHGFGQLGRAFFGDEPPHKGYDGGGGGEIEFCPEVAGVVAG